jgi:hypothetical protein
MNSEFTSTPIYKHYPHSADVRSKKKETIEGAYSTDRFKSTINSGHSLLIFQVRIRLNSRDEFRIHKYSHLQTLSSLSRASVK